jgi:ribosome maturation factor RimP
MGLAPFFCGWNSAGAMKAPDKLTRIVEPVVLGLGYELVGIEFDSHQRVLRIYIDRESGIHVDDCSKVSHQLSGVLDVEDPIPGKYHLEISSPGMDRPLFKIEHYERFSGSMARLQLIRPMDGRRRFKARLRGCTESDVLLEDGEVQFAIPFELIEKARLVPEFESTVKKG